MGAVSLFERVLLFRALGFTSSLFKMGLQSPPHMLGFLVILGCLVFSILALALSAAPSPFPGSNPAFDVGAFRAAYGLGITGGVLGMVFALVGIVWMMLEELWAIGIVKIVIIIAWALGSLFRFIAGILWAVTGFGASSAFCFINFIVLGIGIFILLRAVEAGSGGGSSSPQSKPRSRR